MLATLAKRLVAMDDESCKNNLAVFGDSYSDTGNEKPNPPYPVYDDRRFTNGKVWVEYFAEFMNFNQPTPYYKERGTNYAVAGSATGASETTQWTTDIFAETALRLISLEARGLFLQTKDFLDDVTITTQCAFDTNYVVWAGTVDMMMLVTNPDETITNIANSIRNLTKKGAREIIVLNLPQLAHSPAYVNPGSSIFISDSIPDGLELRVTTFNNELQKMLQSFVDCGGRFGDAIPNFTYTLVDMAALFAEAAKNPDMFSLAEDVTTARLDEREYYQFDRLWYTNHENALWYDGVHPTTTFHKAIAKEVKRVVTGKSQKAAKNPKCKGSKASKVGKA